VRRTVRTLVIHDRFRIFCGSPAQEHVHAGQAVRSRIAHHCMKHRRSQITGDCPCPRSNPGLPEHSGKHRGMVDAPFRVARKWPRLVKGIWPATHRWAVPIEVGLLKPEGLVIRSLTASPSHTRVSTSMTRMGRLINANARAPPCELTVGDQYTASP